MARIPVAFIDPLIGDLGAPPHSINYLNDVEEKVVKGLREEFPGVDFAIHHVRDMSDAEEFLKSEEGAVGYLVVVLNSIVGLLDPILMSGKPVVVIGEAYSGAGEALLGSLHPGRRVITVFTRNPAGREAISRVKHLLALDKLRNSKVLFIVSPSTKSHVTWQFPLSTDLYSVFRSINAITGVMPIIIDAEEFRLKYFNRVNEDEARIVADKWLRGAESIKEPDLNEVINSAKLYLAMREAAREMGVNAVAVDCIVLYNTGLLRAWPCLGYMQLWYDGIIPICEADAYSMIPILIGKYLLGRNGFVVNVGMDSETGEFIYHHCYAPTNPHGGDKPETSYIITTAHLGSKHASIHVKLPTNEKVTVVGFNPEERQLYIHVSHASMNEYRAEACSTKLVAKGNVEKVVGSWRRRSGWHRVVLYGDNGKELKEFAALLGLTIIDENGEGLLASVGDKELPGNVY